MSHRPRRTPGVVRIATKQIRADPVVSLLLAALVLILSLVATVGPRLLTDMNSRQVDYTFSDLSVLQRDVASTTIAPLAYLNVTSDGVEFSDADQTWARVNAGLERIRLDESEPLRTLLEPGRFYIDVDQLAVAPNDPDSDISQIRLQYRVDPALPQIATLVEGNWPVAHLPLNEFAVGGSDGAVLVTTDSEIEIALSQDAAEQLHWEVGEVRDVPGAAQTRLSGTYEPIDPLDTHWSHSPYAPELATFFDADRGTEATAAAYLAPNNPGVVRPGSTRTFKLWYPLDASNVPGDDVASLRAQLGGMTAGESVVIAEGEDPQEVSSNGVPPDGFIEAGMTARFTTELFEPLDALVAQQRTTTSLAAVVAAGPAGVALAVLALGAQLIVTRRRPTLTLAEARGGSRGQVRGLLMAEGALIGLPAAAVGYLLAGIIIAPLTPWPWPALLVAGLIGACPMLALGLARTPGAQTQSRSDLGAAQGKYRVLVETIVLALAALAVWRLLDRGLVSQSSGFDPLVAATPALLALAFGVLTLRLLPVPLRVMTARLHAGKGLAPFLGAVRAVRDPAGGLLPTVVVILSVSVAMVGSVLASTITAGAQDAAWQEAGAEVRVSGPAITDDLKASLAAVPGVTAVAGVTEADVRMSVTDSQGARRDATVYVVDDALAQVQAGTPLADTLPASLFDDETGLKIVSGAELDPAAGALTLGPRGDAEVVGHIDDLPGITTDQRFVVVARSAWEEAGGGSAQGRLALLSVAADSDPNLVANAVAQAVPNSLVETPQGKLDAFLAAPATDGLRILLLAGVVLTTLLTAVAIALIQALRGPSQSRLLAILRTLGANAKQLRSLTAWELAPTLVAASFAGVLVGTIVPWLLLQSLELTILTGGRQQPELAINPVLLGTVLGSVIATVVISTALGATASARTSLAQHLRLGEER